MPGQSSAHFTQVAGLPQLWAETLGDPAITVAVLDGPVDLAHPCFAGADLTQTPTLVSSTADPNGIATAHGTHLASVLFGQPGSPVHGLAPRCRGLLLPVYADSHNGSAISCSQVDLARAITQAVAAGAHVINISGGEITPSGAATPLLAKAVQLCADNNILIVAAAGNEGCECLHVPAALPLVLTVGAMDDQGVPLDFSNWGAAYRAQGVLAPGAAVLGAAPGGGTIARRGTSFATPLVTGAVALLLSLQRQLGRTPDPHAVRDTILETAAACDPAVATNCSRYLRGRFDLLRTIHHIKADMPPRRETMEAYTGSEVAPAVSPAAADPAPVAAPAIVSPAPAVHPSAAPLSPVVTARGVRPAEVRPAQADAGNLVFALGTLGYDFGTDARRDWFASVLKAKNYVPEDAARLLEYFATGLRDGADAVPRDYAATSVIWTLNLDATPIYAIQPDGPFAESVYRTIRSFLSSQIAPSANVDSSRVAVPGNIEGSVTLRSGQVVPVIVPELRGMAQITTQTAAAKASAEELTKVQRANDLQSRLFYELRNLGVAPQERALNAIATYSIDAVRSALVGYEIETVRAEKTPVARPGSDCWDVVVTTFVADRVYESAKKVFRQTVDVSDVVPVFLGQPRIYSTM